LVPFRRRGRRRTIEPSAEKALGQLCGSDVQRDDGRRHDEIRQGQRHKAEEVCKGIRKHCVLDIATWKKLDEVPYDFVRKRMTVLVSGPKAMLTKSALAQVPARRLV
jgi:magnesium-transporting ATPase (P-type)